MKKIRGLKAADAFFYLVTGFVALSSVIPVLFVLAVSLSSEDSIKQYGYSLIPREWSTRAYGFISTQAGDLLSAYRVSILVTVIGTCLSIIITALLAYPLSRKNFVLRNSLSFYVYFTMLFSGGIVPTYIIISRLARTLDLRDSLFVLIFPILVPAFNVLLLRNFFATVPVEVIESAKIDGSGEFHTFIRMVIPMSLPGLATIGLFTSLMYWNDWINALLYIESSRKQPLQYLMQKILTTADFVKNSKDPQVREFKVPQETARMAMCVMAMGPIVLAYPFFQKYFIHGLTIGAVKG